MAVNFNDLRLSEPLLRALATEGYAAPTPIQAQAIPHVLAGKDILGIAQTGTGKTAAFALPILDRLSQKRHNPSPSTTDALPTSENSNRHGSRWVQPQSHSFRGRTASPDRTHPQATSHLAYGRSAHSPSSRDHGRHIRALILAPTRELAAQIGDSFRAYGRHTSLRHAVIFGGVNQNPQTRAVREGIDILVATPGRLLDLVNQQHIDLRHIEVFVLDEADRMLDMGFIHDIRKVAALLPRTPHPQTLLFSATMPADIRQLAATLLRDPVSVQVAAVSATADRIDQSVYFVDKRNKPYLLTHLLLNTSFTRALVFTRTKHGADRVVRKLYQAGIQAAAIHGNKSQSQRLRAMEGFRSGRIPVLIASDIASRGIDIDEISHVINYDLPNVPETYVHRIGRTARAGAEGAAIAFCDHEEKPYLKDIEKLTRIPIPVRNDHPPYPSRAEHEATLHAEGVTPRHQCPHSGGSTSGRGGQRQNTRGGQHRSPRSGSGDHTQSRGQRRRHW